MVAPQNLLSNIPPSRLSKSRSKSSSSVTPSMTITSRPPELLLSFTSVFLQLWNHLKVRPALETVFGIRVSADLHFLSTPARNPLPPSPRPARNGNERMSFFCWFYPQCPLPSQQTTHPAMPVLSLSRRTWPWVTTQYDCDHTISGDLNPVWFPDWSKHGQSLCLVHVLND